MRARGRAAKVTRTAPCVKVRFTSGSGSEVLLGHADGQSMLYPEVRCLLVVKGAGSQGALRVTQHYVRIFPVHKSLRKLATGISSTP